uniref:NADH dehydrogenase subunit 6 n=1 Tax=Carrhotus xanthogramma TaxID=1112393 RepID=A0A0H3W0Z4_CARXA|nr:NADH dehydrogenase subunit 6 [Carrhotus xanthogramma]AKH36475.1 NADH dehydrogenase subunit 6 [Carrhotus xanthogramma]
MLSFLLGLFFVSSMQPMSMISMLILIVLFYSYIMYIVLGGYWFSYALVMVMLSGVLVVFTYMVSLIPNEKFEEYNLLYLLIVMMFMVSGYYMWMYQWKFSFISLSLWYSFFSSMNIFMVSFLLLIMLLVVWLSYYGYGAFRVF